MENRDQPDVKQALDGLLREWTSNLDLYQRQTHPSVTWIAYYQGGVDALSALQSQLE
jgi:hypothetical protein